VRRALAEPTVRFFIVGALLFVGHRLVVGDPRVIVVTPGVRADVERRFRDTHLRAPSAAELESEMRAWEREEVLYREALRDGLDRHDGTIRTVLADRARARVALGVAARAPTDAELQEWLAAHRSQYELPYRYDYESIAFAKTQPGAAGEAAKAEQALRDGADARALGRTVVGGNPSLEELRERLGPTLAARIQRAPVGAWQRLEDDKSWLLVRVNAVAGGLPPAAALHEQLVTDWSFAERQRAVADAVQGIVSHYRIEERR
jgi:hypothetical protein